MPLFNYIDKYQQQKIKIFACNNNKTPAVRTGFYAATCEPDILKEMFHDPANMLIGMATGNMNGIVVIDIDINKNGDIRTREEIIEELRELGDVPDTFMVETPSGGIHAWFTVPYTGLSSSVRTFGKHLPVDIRANGGYVIIPDGKSKYQVYDDVDNLEIDNIKNRCTPLPTWIENYKKSNYSESSQETILPESEVREIRSALSFLSSDDRDLWIRIGLALKSTGSAAGYGLWNEWSQKSDKYKPDDQEQRWKGLKPKDVTIASLFHEAKQAGWVTTYEKRDTLVPSLTVIISPGKIYHKVPFPEDLLRPDGLVGNLVDYINFRAIKKQPILALSGALAAIGALAGRKVQTDTQIRTNIYCLSVGASGCGKENVRKVIKNCFEAADCGKLCTVEDIASDASMVTALKSNPSQIFLLDEIGRFLKTTNQASRSPHLYNVISVLLKLYGAADNVFYGKIYADKDKQERIEQPNLCILGTTVPDTLYKGLTLENVTDGFLARMLIFESETPNPKKERRKNITGLPPKELVDQIKALYHKPINITPAGNLDQFNSVPQLVPINEMGLQLLDEFDDYIYNLREKLKKENRVDNVYNRCTQLAEQIALIIATGINIDNPVITEKEIIYSTNLIKYLSDNMLHITENFIADNDLHSNVKDILNIIRKKGKISATELTKKTQKLQGYVRSDILDTLIMSEQIAEQYEGVGNKKTRWFVAL